MGLATQLRSLDDERLVALFVARPDLLERSPATFEQVAMRAAVYTSQLACLAGLDLFLHQLLELLALAGQPARIERVAELAGPAVRESEVVDGLQRLHELGLVALDAPNVRALGELSHRLGVPGIGAPARTLLAARTVEELRHVVATLGLRSPVPSPRKADLVALVAGHLERADALGSLLGTAPQEVARLLSELDARGACTVMSYSSLGYGQRPSADPATNAVSWLLERGLLVQTSWGTSELIGEVGLLLRNGMPFPGMTAHAPPLAPVPHGAGVDVAAEAGAAAGRLVDLLARIVQSLQAEAAPLLKTGGVGVRAVRRMATLCDVEERDAALLIELAGAAGLVDHGGDDLRPAELFAPWLELDAADRWLHVLRCWLAARGYPRAAGARDANDKVIAPLSSLTAGFEAPEQRRSVLEALTEVPAAHAVDPDMLTAHLVWTAPHRWMTMPADPDVAVTWILQEAAILGATAVGALAPAVRLELAGDQNGARRAAREALPPAESHFIVQADLTVLALGSLDPQVSGQLGRITEVESRGAASVHRLSPASIGRALAAGERPEEILEFLGAHSRSGVPQSVQVLVDDVARRYGRARIGGASAYLRSDDEALVAELVRHRKLAKLGLRQIAPTVAISAAEPEALLAAVSAAGFLPAEEDESGALVVRRPAEPRRSGPRQQLLAGPDTGAAMPDDRRFGAPPRGRRPPPDRREATTRAEALVARLRQTVDPPARGLSAQPGPDGRPGSGPGAAGGARPALARPLAGQVPLDLLGAGAAGGEDGDFASEPAAFPALFQTARREVRAVSLAVYDDDGTVDLVGTPLVVRDDAVALLCEDCTDVHELHWDEIEWAELLGPWRPPGRKPGRGRRGGERSEDRW